MTSTDAMKPGLIDASRLLSLDSTGARIIAAVFIVSNALFTFATLDRVDQAWPSIVAMVLVSATALLLVRSHPDPFPLRDTLIVVSVVIVSTALVSWQLPLEGPPARSAWHLGANTWLVFFLALRRRTGFAWFGLCAMTAVTIAWAVDTGRGVSGAITLVQVHFGILLVATLFAVNLRRTSASINALNERSVQAAASFAAADAAQAIRQQRFTELTSAVVPLLSAIAADEPNSDERRREFRAVEATLRDGVRGRSLMVPHVQRAAREARERGVDVTVLDDRGAPLRDGDAMQRASEATVAALKEASHGVVTVRLLPKGRDVALTIVSDLDDRTTRVDIDAEGYRAEGTMLVAADGGDDQAAEG